MTLLDLVILALATWRIGSLAHYERGPFRIFGTIRSHFGVTHDDDGEPIAWPDTEMGRLIRCLDCGSVWIGLGLAGLYFLSPRWAVVLAFPFALSAAAIGLEVIIGGTRKH